MRSDDTRRAGQMLSRLYWALQARYGRYPRLARRFFRREGLIVSGGPFAGMVYVRRAAVARIVAKLIGSYEAELHDVLSACIQRGFETVVNVGSAEGYYAVGMARSLPGAKVYAFESDKCRRGLCGMMARANGVTERVTLHGACTAEELAALPLAGALVICDCEGAELDILRPEVAPALRTAWLVVELHDCFIPGLTGRLTARFESTHEIRIIPESPRAPERYPALRGFNEVEQRECLDEWRRGPDGQPYSMHWAVMTPRPG